MEEIIKRNKGGRPKKGDDARNIQVNVSISNNDLKEITRLQSLSEGEIKASEIIYQRFKNGTSPIVQLVGFDQEDRRLLSIANNNINQIARQMNAQSNAYISDLHSKLLKEAIEQLKRIEIK